jgi:hypothetical protein
MRKCPFLRFLGSSGGETPSETAFEVELNSESKMERLTSLWGENGSGTRHELEPNSFAVELNSDYTTKFPVCC